MTDLTEAIDRMIADCSKRDLVPSNEIVDGLLDLRALTTTTTDLPVFVSDEEELANV